MEARLGGALDLESGVRLGFHGTDCPAHSYLSEHFLSQLAKKGNFLPGSTVILMSVMIRSSLRIVLSFVLTADGSSCKECSTAVLHHGLHARKLLLAARHELVVLRSLRHLPDLSDLITQVRTNKAVALTGAGFSMPAGLLSWTDLLKSLLSSAVETEKIKEGERVYIQGLIEENTSEAFDKTAQLLEKYLGVERMQDEIKELLKVDPSSMPRKMQQRVRTFMDIPWRAILTTNYDSCLKGPTPACPDVGKAYVAALRTGPSRIGDRIIGAATDAPVVKLHGCVERGNIVFTRSGYRKLLYKDPGYQVFLQSLIASYTIVRLGHSGKDSYLNDFRSEVLTMFGETSGPLGYSVAPVSEAEASFSSAYDGIDFLSWDLEREGFGLFDTILDRLRRATSPRARMRSLLRGRHILLVDSATSNPEGWQLVEIAQKLFRILPVARIDLLESPDNLRDFVKDAASSKVAPYDVVLMVFDEKSTHLELEAYREAPLEYDLPFAVIESDSPENCRGIKTLKGCNRVVRSMSDASEYLFSLFDQSAQLHRR